VSPTVRSLAHLRDQGYHVEIVEQNKRAGIKVWKQDLWGWADLLCVRRGEVLAVQVTSRSNVSSRVKKITDSPLLPLVREAGIRVLVHGWDADKLKEIDLS
jgi:hypothetical protein